jgi:hypothetical protein
MRSLQTEYFWSSETYNESVLRKSFSEAEKILFIASVAVKHKKNWSTGSYIFGFSYDVI